MGISRASASKRVNRDKQFGELGLTGRSSASAGQPTAAPRRLVERITSMRREHKWSASRIALASNKSAHQSADARSRDCLRNSARDRWEFIDRMLAGSEWHDEDLVFAQVNGRPIDKENDHDDWTRLLKAAGVRLVRLHDGRYTAATLLLSENVDPRGGHGPAGPQPDAHDDGHLQPRDSGAGQGGRRPDERPAVARCHRSNCNHKRVRPLSRRENGLIDGVELRGLEPLTPTLPVWCATSCATAPCRPGLVCPSRRQPYRPGNDSQRGVPPGVARAARRPARRAGGRAERTARPVRRLAGAAGARRGSAAARGPRADRPAVARPAAPRILTGP
jgi:integrase